MEWAEGVSGRLITLEQWLELNYDTRAAPSIGTARRWAKNGNIHPQPVKNGRSYYLSQSAVYTSGSSDLVERLIREQAEEAHAATA